MEIIFLFTCKCSYFWSSTDCVEDKNIGFHRLLDKSKTDQLALEFWSSVTVLQEDISDIQKSLLKTSSAKYLIWTQHSSGAAFALQGARGRVQGKGRAAGQCFPDDLMRICVPAVPFSLLCPWPGKSLLHCVCCCLTVGYLSVVKISQMFQVLHSSTLPLHCSTAQNLYGTVIPADRL